MATDSAFGALNKKQQRCIALYTNESKRDTYLNRVASYTACYKTARSNAKGLENSAHRLFRKQNIQAAIKEILPPLAYDQIFVSNEYMFHYVRAKKKGDEGTDHCLKILDSMAKHSGMLDKKKEADTSNADTAKLKEMSDAINTKFLKRQKEMEEAKDGS